jgi:hypothetical protein
VLSASVESITQDLFAYGEDETGRWLPTCTDDELVRVCSVAQWLLFYAPSRRSGGSMLIAKACALAAVYVREGSPRELHRSRRMKVSDLPPFPWPERRPDYQVQGRVPADYGVGDDARAVWAT